MDDVGDDALAGLAYGLFEILLNRELQVRGFALFRLVEGGENFRDAFDEIFGIFREEYPQLAGALLEKSGSTTDIYDLLCGGEGVVPSQTTQMYWIVQDAPSFHPEEADDEKMGKWLIFLEKDAADEAWGRIRDATFGGRLGVSAKVSTGKPNPDSWDERTVIYVYTTDWEDEEDVMRIREVLRSFGIEQRIGYKRNIETYKGDYSENGRKVTYYSA
jgi:hypothetical protein